MRDDHADLQREDLREAVLDHRCPSPGPRLAPKIGDHEFAYLFKTLSSYLVGLELSRELLHPARKPARSLRWSIEVAEGNELEVGREVALSVFRVAAHRFNERPHGLDVLLRHRPPSIPLPLVIQSSSRAGAGS
jgi:hypothetical protein